MKKLIGIFTVLICSACITASAQYPSRVVVAPDGSGDVRSINEAIARVRAYSPVPLEIFIKNGVYREKVVVPSWVTNITFRGESRDKTIIAYDDYSGKFISSDTATNKEKFSTFTSYTFWVQGNDVTITNLTISNTAGRVGQAVALHVDGDRFVIRDCNLLGNQDTLLTANESSRQLYDNCLIEGTTDFIFGGATAVFYRCTIRSLSDSYITAASTSRHQKFGYVFIECDLVSGGGKKVYLGRPWRAHARTVFLNCHLGEHIRPEGWHNWSNAENEKTAFYAEYNCKGPGAATGKRVAWSHQLTKKEAREYTIDNIFSGTTPWNPELNRTTN